MKYRDLDFIPWDEKSCLVISCDSAGGIGDKKGDVIFAEPRVLGYHTASVALMEMLSIGVFPFFLSNTLSVEMDPTGLEIIKGIKDALSILDLDSKVEITGSTEENINVTSSGMGLTLMGRVSRKDFRFPKTKDQDVAAVIGSPACGQGVTDGDESSFFSLKALKKIMGKDYIHEIIPAGSRGIDHEITQLIERSKLIFRQWDTVNFDIYASAGPATSALVTLNRDHLELLRKDIEIPVIVIGEFAKAKECETNG